MDVIEVNGSKFNLTKHAIHRANKRSITLEEIGEALYNPKNIRRTSAPEKPDSYTYFGRNGVAVVVNLEMTVIITVLRRSSAYCKAKSKEAKNKRQVKNKKLYGNRAKK